MSDFRERLEDFGIPVDAVDGIVNERIAQAFGQLQTAATTMQMAQASPEGDAVLRYLNDNPAATQKVLQMANVDPASAAEFAVLSYRASGGRGSTARAPHASTTYLATPGLPSAQAGAPAWTPPIRDVDAAAQAYAHNPNKVTAEQLFRARVGPILREQFAAAGQDLGPDVW